MRSRHARKKRAQGFSLRVTESQHEETFLDLYENEKQLEKCVKLEPNIWKLAYTGNFETDAP